jgi:mannose-1-phosphate guanylyltransferase
MKAVILVGGLGTRLRPLSYNTPKAMMPVLNVPFLEWVIRRLKNYGFDEPVLAISHLAGPIQDYFGDGRRFGVSINYSIEETGLGTAGGVKNAERFLGDEPFAVLNGDIFTDLDLGAMLEFHRRNRAKITIALTPVEDPTQYGLVETDAQGKIIRFLEKPARDQITTNMINAGTYILEPDVLASIPAQTCYSFEHKVFPFFQEQGAAYAFPFEGYWMDIGTPQKYRQLNLDLLAGNSNQFRLRSPAEVAIGNDCRIHPKAIISGPAVIGEGCCIGSKARLAGPFVIGRNTKIDDDASVDSSVVWDDIQIGEGAKVIDSVIASGCRLGDGSIIENSVLAHRVKLAAGCRLTGDSVMPDTAVQ